MSAPEKIRRQGQAMLKKDSHYRISSFAKAWLKELAVRYSASEARVLEAILRKKPEPDDFYLR